MESFKDIGRNSPAERGRRTLDRARANDEKLGALLTPLQQQRLKQIGLQSEGAAAFRDQEVAISIGLSPQQRERVRVIEDDAAYGWMRGPNRSLIPSSADEAETQILSTNERILEVLTEVQTRKWHELTGEPLKAALFPFRLPATSTPGTKYTADPPSNGVDLSVFQ